MIGKTTINLLDLLNKAVKSDDDQDFKDFLKAFFEQEYKQLYPIAKKNVNNKEDVKDAIHDLYVRIYENRKVFPKRFQEAGESIHLDLYGIIKYHAMNYDRSNKNRGKKKYRLIQ